MEEFKIGDDFDEEGNVKEHKVDKKIIILIVIGISIVFGLLVFLVSNAIFGGHDDDTPVDTQVNIDDETVKILYKTVAHKEDYGNDLFLRENNVTIDTFKDEDKLYYALQFVQPEELTYSEQMTDNKQKIYDLSLSRIRNYLPTFFGKDVSFTPVEELTYKFDFTINDLGIAKLTYNDEEEVYKVVFESLDEAKEAELVKPYYTELSSATKKADGTLILNEKVIYASSTKESDTYKINIYKDYQHTTLIEARQDVTKDDLNSNPISIEKYKDRAATITYTFKVKELNKNYYFAGSSITY